MPILSSAYVDANTHKVEVQFLFLNGQVMLDYVNLCTNMDPPQIDNKQKDQSMNQLKRKTSYAKRSLKTKQHTTPDELESHNPRPANHMDTPHTGEPLRPHKHYNIGLEPDANTNRKILACKTEHCGFCCSQAISRISSSRTTSMLRVKLSCWS